MGMSTHVVGFKSPDEKFRKMKAVWDACTAAGVPMPPEVDRFFDGVPPDEAGVEVPLDYFNYKTDERALAKGVRAYRAEGRQGYEIVLSELDPDVQIVRFFNSY